MRRAAFASLWFTFAVAGRCFGSVYIPQASFSLAPTSVAGMDSDSVGNLYVLGRAAGGATYGVSSYATQGITPLFAFDTGVSSVAAFAVEGSGVVDVLDASLGPGAVVLTRFQNNGAFVGRSTYSIASPYSAVQWTASAIDKVNQRVYLAKQQWTTFYCLQCLGCPCSPSGTQGFIAELDFAGTLLRTITMPGISATAGSCYTPSLLTVDPQGNLYVADAACGHLLKYSSAGTLASDTPASKWTSRFAPRGMWTDSGSSLYISEPVCGPTGCSSGVAKLGPDGTLETSFWADSPGGCAWDPRILYLSSSGGEPLRRFVFNGPPTVAPQISPLGSVVQHSPSAALSWQPSSDPDGDAVSYAVLLSSSASQLSPIGGGPQGALASGPLVFGTTYFWQVAATDSYLGLPLQGASSPVVSFNLNLLNNPPGDFVYLSTAGVLWQHALAPSVDLSWRGAIDPDGDPVSYRLDVQTSTGSLPSTDLGAATNSTLSLPFGTTYYWRIAAYDPYGGVSTGPWSSVVVQLANRAPNPLVYSAPPDLITRATSFALTWQDSGDPDNDPVVYSVYLSTDPGNPYLVQQGTATSYLLSLQFGSTYYWRVSASDPFGATVEGAFRSFLPTFLNDPPGAVALTAPFIGSPVISTMKNTVAVSWAQVTTPQGDPITYAVYLGDSTGSLQPLTKISQTIGPSGLQVRSTPLSAGLLSQVELDGTNVRLTLSGLDYYRTYYIRVTAANPYGASSTTPVQSFSLSPQNGFPKAYNYPNPFSPNRGGTHLVFNAPPSGFARAKVSIYSELQDLLFEREYTNIPSGISETTFDGRDRYGRPFFNGSYICRVRFSGPDDAAIFYLLVVK